MKLPEDQTDFEEAETRIAEAQPKLIAAIAKEAEATNAKDVEKVNKAPQEQRAALPVSDPELMPYTHGQVCLETPTDCLQPGAETADVPNRQWVSPAWKVVQPLIESGRQHAEIYNRARVDRSDYYKILSGKIRITGAQGQRLIQAAKELSS